jgi:ligand-binding SRPBCC domain-containing protein
MAAADPNRAGIVLVFSSQLAQPRAVVWATVSTMSGVNAELMPFVRMTYPRDLPALANADLVPGKVVFQSWLLFLGVLPFDRHALALEQVTDGEGFVEESTSWMQRRWRHERRIADRVGGGCIVTDRLTIEPRLAVLSPVTRIIVTRLFAHRHRRLRRRFRVV